MFPMKFSIRQLIFLRQFILIMGVILTSYLIYVNNLSDSTLSCGNVGDCNKVQNSSYGFLFGAPVTYFGLVFFCFLAILYGNYFLRKNILNVNIIELVGFSASLSAFIFSMYLTYIELFVINEICIWCVSIALLTTLIFIINFCSLIFIKKHVEDDDKQL